MKKGSKHTMKSINKMRENCTGKPHPHKGHPMSDVLKEKIAKASRDRVWSKESRQKEKYAKTGKNNPQFGKPLTEAHKIKLSKANKGQVRSDEAKVKMHLAQLGNKKMLGKHHSEATKQKIREARIGKKNPNMNGAKNPAWKGGVTPINHKIRTSSEYEIWRQKVFIRDDFTCQSCFQRGGDLHAHHLIKFSIEPKLRFDVRNGITLHEKCHHKIHRKIRGNQ